MDTLKGLSTAFINLIRIGSVTRITYCFLKIMASDDETQTYIKRIKNVIIFYILAESVWQLKDLAMHYFY